MEEHKVGDHIKDGSGKEWVVAKVYKWPKWIDYELINTETGDYGALRRPNK
jgi:hypothetical protein